MQVNKILFSNFVKPVSSNNHYLNKNTNVNNQSLYDKYSNTPMNFQYNASINFKAETKSRFVNIPIIELQNFRRLKNNILRSGL